MRLKDFLQGKPLGHPSHPLFVHFPSALFPTSLLFDLLSWAFDEPALVKAALYTIGVGLAPATVAILTGFVDYFGMVPGSSKRRVATWHWVLTLPMVLIFSLAVALRAGQTDAAHTSLPLIGLSLIGVALLTVGNYFGAELVYRMGMRVSTGPRRETPLVVKAAGILRRAWHRDEPKD